MSNLSPDDAHSELARLITPGVLGFYTHYEVTEVFAKQDGSSSVINVFSIAVAEDRGSEALQPPVILNSDRIKLKLMAGWNFGVMRYTRPITELGCTRFGRHFVKVSDPTGVFKWALPEGSSARNLRSKLSG